MTEGQEGTGQSGGEQGGQDWKAALPEELRSNEHVAKHPTVESAIKSLVHGQELIAKRPQSMADLDPPSDPETRAKVFAKLGRPEKPDEYKLPGEARDFRMAAHEANLTAEQAEKLYASLDGANSKTREQTEADFKAKMEQYAKQTEETYRGKWGDKYDEEMAKVKQATEKFIPASAREEIEAMGLQNEPWFIDVFNILGDAMAEDTLLGGPGAGAGSVRDVASIESDLAKLTGDPEYQDAIKNPWHLKHATMKDQYRKLMDELTRTATKDGTVDPHAPKVSTG